MEGREDMRAWIQIPGLPSFRALSESVCFILNFFRGVGVRGSRGIFGQRKHEEELQSSGR